MFYFYILYSAILDKFYIGMTSDSIDERLRRHNTNHKGFTGKASDWEIAYTELYQSKSEAYSRERLVKSWKSRKRIEALIRGAKFSGS
ncbi:GIY-YIG nuclease family protein [Taibaiella lutea]|uniref:GIY-YIG nuclease family protein n=1 Tax=Taibaiella lutea TaxID=2608001 RepID=A0A5M6CI07_9BACT|nr:GIY-YIG nuclease family protein [Taibaiella lutea]KAA5534848.1 GIY-YIG nuclease family protein [Taibaiella lutea]